MDDNKRKKRAIGYSLATMLILIGILGVIVNDALAGDGVIGQIFFFVCLIISVGMYVYLGCMDKRDINHEENINNNHKASSPISNIIWLIATSVFFLVGFIFDGWDYAWVAFLLGAAAESIARLYLDNKTKD